MRRTVPGRIHGGGEGGVIGRALSGPLRYCAANNANCAKCTCVYLSSYVRSIVLAAYHVMWDALMNNDAPDYIHPRP